MSHGEPPFGPSVKLDRPAFVDPTVRIFCDVTAGEGTSFWPYTVLRAEMHGIRIGKFCQRRSKNRPMRRSKSRPVWDIKE